GRGIWTVSLPELEGYEPPTAIALLPILEVLENGLGGMVDASYFLRSDYDSVFAEINVLGNDRQPINMRFQIENNQAQTEGSFNISIDGLSRDTIINAEVSLIGYQQGKAYEDIELVSVFGVDEQPRHAYATDFDDDSRDFARIDFNIYREEGFESKALHSLHPYEGFDQTYLAVLTVPIIVSASNSVLAYDEIAMIEPGEAGTVFGDPDFFDYVAIEGTRDLGRTWEVIDAYDARLSRIWVNNFQEDAQTIDPMLIETHMVDLASVFNPQDTIFLRFRLQSDPLTEGWGWVIDNLSIQEDLTNSTDIDLSEKFEISALPNPARNFINLHYKLTKTTNVNIDVYSVSGKLLSSLEQGIKPAGEYQAFFDAHGLSPGIYIFYFTTGKGTLSLKWIRL
ncbi:MAG: T9SS type A sorting domain-containing protein, partial [Saprospiraceae bacterium]|nr:T9SS type A sorting domain-containing protein [Saprospiraceae bacterium]